MKQSTRLGSIMRLVSGESIFKSKWKNEGATPGFVALTPSIPATVIPLNLDALGNSVLCSRHAFLASINPDVRLTVGVVPAVSCMACCFSGMTPVMQNVKGTGWVCYLYFATHCIFNVMACPYIGVSHCFRHSFAEDSGPRRGDRRGHRLVSFPQ
jgi:uncharacterized protein (AIM24 family)